MKGKSLAPRGSWKRQPLDPLTHNSGCRVVAVARQRVFQLMPRVKGCAGGMKCARARAAPFTGELLHGSPQSAVFHCKNAQPVATEIGREQMASGGGENQRMGMRRPLQLCVLPAACFLINTARAANAPVLRNRKEVINS